MGYQHLQNTLKAIALTVPAARAFEITVEFVLGEGKDTATVGRLEDHFRDRPPMKACIERMKADPTTRKCIEDRYFGPELDLDMLITYPRGSLGYTYAKVMKHLGYAAHFYGDRPSIAEETDYVTLRVRMTHDLHHIVTGFSMTGPGDGGHRDHRAPVRLPGLHDPRPRCHRAEHDAGRRLERSGALRAQGLGHGGAHHPLDGRPLGRRSRQA